MSVPKFFILLLSLLASVTALATPHTGRSAHHRALAGRIPVPAPVDTPALSVRKRQNSKRCRPHSPAPVQATKSSSHASKPTSKAPRPTTNHPSEPKITTSRYQAPPTKPTPNVSSSSHTGEGTFYGTGLGACGITNQDSDFIVAVSSAFFDSFPGYARLNPNNNPVCGKKITATYQGKSVTVTVVDRCTGCKTHDLDFSPAAFKQLASFDIGRLEGVRWILHA